MQIQKPHSQCSAQELMDAIAIEVVDGVATLTYPDVDPQPEAQPE